MTKSVTVLQSDRNLKKAPKQIRLGAISEDADAAEYEVGEVGLGNHLRP